MPLERGVIGFRDGERVIPVALDRPLTDGQADIDYFLRVWPLPDEIPKAEDPLYASSFDIVKYCVQCGDVPVNVGNQSDPVHLPSVPASDLANARQHLLAEQLECAHERFQIA